MKRTLITLIIIFISFTLSGQIRDLGLNGVVTWIDSTHIRVEYDWSNDSQLLDWVMTKGSTLVRENGTLTITDGNLNAVLAMIWKQGIKCSRIMVKDAVPLSSAGHLNFYSNLISFTGYYLPDPGLGIVLSNSFNFWTKDGASSSSIGAPFLVVGVPRDYEYNVSPAGMTIKSSINDVVYSFNTPCVPAFERKIALGGWGGNTRWGRLTIEGEINVPWQPPSDMINIQSYGATFAPVIEVTGTPVIEWVFDDSTTSSSTTPAKNYGSVRSRHNLLKVTPWTALKGINVGYDAIDGGYGGFAMVANQNVLGFQNLNLAKSSLQYLCANYNLMAELDLRELTALKFVELYNCKNLEIVRLGTHPVLERLCVELCNLVSLDLSGCAAMGDLRGAMNQYTSINWGSIGQAIWHICIRDNPQFTVGIPSLTQFPLLRELLIWNSNQTGAFVCHSSVIQYIDAYQNHYTSADISGCTNLRGISFSGSQLGSLDLGLKDCGLTEPQIDYVLHTLDGASRSNGILELTGNAEPSADGRVHLNNLKGRGWNMLPVTDITVTGAGGSTTITTDNGSLQLSAAVLPVNATDKTVTWLIINGKEKATINTTGLVTAVDNGTVTISAGANVGSFVFPVYGFLVITISNQIVPVSGITVTGAGGVTKITSDNGTLQLSAAVLPVNATDQTVTWSIINGTGEAIINATGLVTAVNNGTVTARATAIDGSGVFGTLIITISPLTGIPDTVERTESLKIIVTSYEIKILLNDDYISWKAGLYNLQGGLVISKLVESDILVFDISSLPSGIYFAVLSKGENRRVAKVVKP
jgi:hypothetical protein